MATSKKSAKAAAPKATAKKSAASKSAKPAAKSTAKKTARTPNAAFMAPKTVSPELAAIVGNKPLPRTEIVKKMWDYIKAHDLQDSKNKRMINADDKLKAVFEGKKQFSMFDIAKAVNNHIQK